MRAFLLLPFLLFACGKKPTVDPAPFPDPVLKSKYDLYLSLQPPVRDANGFIDADLCDSLMFTGLGSFDYPVDIEKAKDADTGQWFRTPDHLCYPGRSGSTISRDMLLGLMWYAWIHENLDIANGLYDYALSHNWIMGEGPIDRTAMSPALMATLAQLVYKLGGHDHTERNAPVAWLPGATGFMRHYNAWHILLRERLYDQIESSGPMRLKEYAASQPENPLYQYAIEESERAVQLLIDSPLYPNGRLPTSLDRCETWAIQRDSDDAGLQPCDQNRMHSGGELLALGYLILQGK